MRLKDYILAMRQQRTGSDNSPQLAQSLEPVTPDEGATTKKKTFNKKILNTVEEASHPSPYMQNSETLTTPNPTSEDPSLRQHIQNYRKHSIRPELGSFNKRSYV